MKVELELDEARELFSLIVDRIAAEASLSDEDRAKVRRWRSQEMKTTSQAMRDLTAKLNADLERFMQIKQKSALRRSDWM